MIDTPSKHSQPDASVTRYVSFYEIYAAPDGDRARLGTGTYEEVFSREISMPRIVCFFGHATDAYLRSFVRFGMAHFDKDTQKMIYTYESALEEMGGPAWLFRMADDLIAAGLSCIHDDLAAQPDGYWIRIVHEQPPDLITSSQAFAELAGKESPSGVLAIHVLFQGSLTEIFALSAQSNQERTLQRGGVAAPTLAR